MTGKECEVEILRGFKDILPDNIDKWQFLETTARNTIESFGFREIRTPILEKTQLFKRSVGETTDIVEKEMYTFLDKNNESITMRPEGTAGVVRAYIDNHLELSSFKKYYYIGPMFRYERPQKGRLRQFHQIGIEVFGIDEPAIDAEVVYINKALLNNLGINNVRIEINNIGCDMCRPNYMDALKSYFEEYRSQLCEDCQKRLYRNPLRILDCKNEHCRLIAKGAPKITSFACETCRSHYDVVKEKLTDFGVDFIENPMLVRGLDYYTKFVFEIITDKLGAQGTVSAGGRYDNLVEQLGGKSTSGVGFAAGEERLIELIEDYPKNRIDFYIASLDVDEYAVQIANKLRGIGKKVYVEYERRSLKSMMKRANRMNAEFAVIIGENEKNNRKVMVKNLFESKQSEYSLEAFLDEVK